MAPSKKAIPSDAYFKAAQISGTLAGFTAVLGGLFYNAYLSNYQLAMSQITALNRAIIDKGGVTQQDLDNVNQLIRYMGSFYSSENLSAAICVGIAVVFAVTTITLTVVGLIKSRE